MLWLVGCTADEGTQSTAGTGFQAGDGTVTILTPDERPQAPELAGPDLDGNQISTADFAGKMIILNVWGSWCPPCRAEAEDLVLAAQQLPDVQFLGVNTRDLDPAPAQAFVRQFEVPYPSIYDPDGALLLEFHQLPPAAIPSTLVIDEDGRVAARILGGTTARTLVQIVEDVRAA